MELDKIRKEIDTTDDELLSLFLRRMELSGSVAEYKRANSLPVVNKTREREILARISKKSGDLDLYSRRLFSTIFELSRSYQNTLLAGSGRISGIIDEALSAAPELFPQSGTIACQGVEGAYSQLACDRLFPRGNIVYLRSFEGVFDAVDSGLCNFGILPIENSSNGSVRAVYDLMQKKNFYIVRSVRLCVRHELLARPGTKLEDIREIYSHEQAIGQCSGFIKTLGDNVSVIPCDNTAAAAKYASENAGVAAISSHNCAELYGLETVSDNIQNSANNYTRFICIAKQPVIYPGANKISLMLSTPHTPGALYELMSRFNALGINLTKLESHPIAGHDFEFLFFFDLEASAADRGVKGMLEDLERTCETFVFLGNYSEI